VNGGVLAGSFIREIRDDEIFEPFFCVGEGFEEGFVGSE
jgi:hypothetical protein